TSQNTPETTKTSRLKFLALRSSCMTAAAMQYEQRIVKPGQLRLLPYFAASRYPRGAGLFPQIPYRGVLCFASRIHSGSWKLSDGSASGGKEGKSWPKHAWNYPARIVRRRPGRSKSDPPIRARKSR